MKASMVCVMSTSAMKSRELLAIQPDLINAFVPGHTSAFIGSDFTFPLAYSNSETIFQHGLFKKGIYR